MPVFFFLDPAMADDWRMDNVDQVQLCYTFFQVEEDDEENDALIKAAYEQQQKLMMARNAQIQEVLDKKHAEAAAKNNDNNNNNNNINSSNNSNNNIPEGQEMICPIIPPTADHNPSGMSLYKAMEQMSDQNKQ
eukprot:UN01289